MERLRVALLGAFQVSRGDADLPVPGARSQGLVVRLALAGGRPVGQDTLVDAIWAEDPPGDSAHALQGLVSRLRRTLGSSDVVAQVAGGYRLDVDAGDVDALRFEQLAAAGRDRLRADDPQGAAAVLGEAVALWGDRPGAEPTVVAAVAPAAATRLAQTSVEAVADLAAAELSLGRADTAADRLTALLAEHRLHERAAALLMDALAALGRQGEALAVYERIREALADALGADPGAALRERHLRLLRAERPALAAETRSGNLPAPLTSFVGRDDDLARIGVLLAAGRLVTVLGPGGAGKTRLAVEAARRHDQGAWMIDLSPATEPSKVGAAVLAGIGQRGGAMFEPRARGDELDVLAGRDILLLIDNCEHLIDAVAHLVASLLSRHPELRVLATSREPLAVDGEALVPLGPLALPEPDDGVEQACRTASVRLFTERAAAVRPGFEVDGTTLPEVLRVVRALDGMPLALELAAARLRTLSLPELADGLSDRFRLLSTGSRTAQPRHRTLGAVIAWSWDLLSEHERTVAERVSVLPGGVTAASATAVCAGSAVPSDEIPELLASLVDRSLLQLAPESGRYRMLETLREYGIARLGEAGGAVRDLAAGYFAELMAHHDPLLRGPGQLAAMRAISADYDNTLAALRHRCATGDAQGAVALALSLTWYWHMFGRHSDAAYWLGEAMVEPGGERDALPGMLATLASPRREEVIERLADGDDGVVVRVRPPAPCPARRERGRARQDARGHGGRLGPLPPGGRPLGPGHHPADARPAQAVRRRPGRRAGRPARGPVAGRRVRRAQPRRRGVHRPALDRLAPAPRRHRPGDRGNRLGQGAGQVAGDAGPGRRVGGPVAGTARRPGPGARAARRRRTRFARRHPVPRRPRADADRRRTGVALPGDGRPERRGEGAGEGLCGRAGGA